MQTKETDTHGVGGVDAFALPLDNLLELKVPQVRAYLALMALLYRSSVISDSWAFANAGLIEALLSTPDGQELLSQGLLRVALRDTRDSFGDVLAEFRAANHGQGMHGLVGDDAYARFLDMHASKHCVRFPRARVGANYTQMMNRVLNMDFLVRVGVTPEAAAVAMRVINTAKDDGTYVDSNTFVKNVVLPQISSPQDQQLIMDTARAPYSLNLPTLLHMGVQGPDNYTGDRVLRLMSGTQTAGSVGVTSAALTIGDAFSAVVGDASVRWLFSSTTLTALTTEDLVAARTTHDSDRLAYLTALEAFLGKPSSEAWLGLVGCMQTYFKKAAHVVLNRWAVSSRLADEPIGAPVMVDASGASLKILLDDTLQISAIGGDVSSPRTLELEVPNSVQLIGRTLTVPAVDEQSA